MAEEDSGQEQAQAAGSVPLTLEEFCMRLSQTDNRVELIGAFNYAEKVENRVKDHESEYLARFVAFTNKQV